MILDQFHIRCLESNTVDLVGSERWWADRSRNLNTIFESDLSILIASQFELETTSFVDFYRQEFERILNFLLIFCLEPTKRSPLFRSFCICFLSVPRSDPLQNWRPDHFSALNKPFILINTERERGGELSYTEAGEKRTNGRGGARECKRMRERIRMEKKCTPAERWLYHDPIWETMVTMH